MEFEWDDGKNTLSIAKHGLSFYDAQDAFFDEKRVILSDSTHSSADKRLLYRQNTERPRRDHQVHEKKWPHPHYWCGILAER